MFEIGLRIGPSGAKECQLQHKDGHDEPIIKHASVIKDEDGRVLGVVETVTDVSEMNRARQRAEEAHEGTIFLDEIGGFSPYIQVKLLRVLQEREIERIGESVKRKLNLRIITATHQDLGSLVNAGKFRGGPLL